MAKNSAIKSEKPPLRTPTSEEAREKQLISLAMDQAEEQLRNHTAPAPVVVHFLKLGTMLAQVEYEKLVNENELIKAKTEGQKAITKNDDLAAKALEAFRTYRSSIRTEADDEP